MKILVVIANYGTVNDQYLSHLLKEYREMHYNVDIVVLSNIWKDLGSNIQVIVGLPDKNPWSLPFAHKKVFAERMHDYDLFIYSEDDTLITERNIDAFLRVTSILPKDEIAGFLRSEADSEGNLFFVDVHSHFHWEPGSVVLRDEYTFAFFTNEHSACYLLTQKQLQRAIETGGFLVPPHEGKYDLLVTAATDPYTQCGFTKLLCVSHLKDFVVRHLTNKYVGRLGIESIEFYRQIEALSSLKENGRPCTKLFDVETRLLHQRWSKSYYEDCRFDLVSAIPKNVKTVLSIGCGWGVTEEQLAKNGARVVGVPLDSVIASCAEAKGIEIVYGDIKTARNTLGNERFDCILFSDVLHLVRDPIDMLSSFTELLAVDGTVVVKIPNFSCFSGKWKWIRRHPNSKELGSYDKIGVHLTTPQVVRKWFENCHLFVDRSVNIVPQRWQFIHRLLLGWVDELLASEIIITGQQVAPHDRPCHYPKLSLGHGKMGLGHRIGHLVSITVPDTQ